MRIVGRDVIPPNQGSAEFHPAPHHLLVCHYRNYFRIPAKTTNRLGNLPEAVCEFHQNIIVRV